jgi:hypothetical protein
MIAYHISTLWGVLLFCNAVAYICLNLYTKARLSVINGGVRQRNQLREQNIGRLLQWTRIGREVERGSIGPKRS